MTDIILLLGGNSGDMKRNISTARDKIDSLLGSIIKQSSLYTSSSWGFHGAEFFNQVVVCQTELNAQELLFEIWDIERVFGRERGTVEQELEKYNKRKYGEIEYCDRAMDIDILYFGDEIIQSPLLSIPHPLIAHREFVLRPLSEIFPDRIFLGQTQRVSELLENIESNDCKIYFK